MRNKILMTLALLVTVATGAWAQFYIDIDGTSVTLKWGTPSEESIQYDVMGGFYDPNTGDFPQVLKEIQTLTIDASCKDHTSQSLFCLFNDFNSLKTINNIEKLKTEGVTNMQAMFGGCSSLQSLDLSSFNTASVTNMQAMFAGCSSLQSLDLSSFNTASVTNMSYMFEDCSNLENIYVGDGWSTQAVTHGDFMFDNCSKLPGYDGSKTSHAMAKLTTDGGYLKKKSEPVVEEPVKDFKWDATTKTGTFTMPGGNVTLEPEYYPQAALTAAPTAINDVPATTDGAIVKAGTVANIGSTTTAQGTVMYYVSQTALDDAALLALAADQWTADVPTAEKLAQGEAYVYYYVRGNDSDTDAENFSDGDILAANALTVTIAAEPTYDVTFAEGTQDADKWTVKAGTDGSFQSLPLEGVKAGTKVKLKYDGDRSMLKGVKAVKKAAAGIVNPVVGQVIGSDGKNYDANATLPDGVTAVAVIAYVGSETGDDTYKNGLAIALADESNSNWSTAKSTCEGKSAVSGAAWLLPSQKQWKTMFKANGGNEGSYSGLNTAIGTAGGTALQVNERYWSSSELDADFAWVLVLGENSAGWDGAPEDLGHQVRACLAF